MNPDVLVVGGGPGGSAAAYWLARDGHAVMLVEKKEYPREKTCGDGLTPRSIHQLTEMGFDFGAEDFHRVTGLRSYAGELCLEMEWPEHPVYPKWGGGIRRAALDAAAGHAVPGYGWVFPMGDGTVNIGVGVLSTFHRWKELNTTMLMEAMVFSAPPHWEVTAESQLDESRGGKLPMAFSVGPLVGRNWV